MLDLNPDENIWYVFKNLLGKCLPVLLLLGAEKLYSMDLRETVWQTGTPGLRYIQYQGAIRGGCIGLSLLEITIQSAI